MTDGAGSRATSAAPTTTAAALPSPAAGPAAIKDWFHLNLLDHASGIVGLVNLSVHGSPPDPRSRAVGAALLHVPGVGWVGNVEVTDVESASIGRSMIGLEHLGLAVDELAGSALVSVRLPGDGLVMDLTATWQSRPFDLQDALHFADGWVGWHVIPRVAISGRARIGGADVPLDGASGYYDHTWGRWHWGSDFRWDWGAFLAPAPGPAFIFSRATDHARRELGPSMFIADDGDRRRTFLGPTVTIRLQGRLEVPRIRRVPGALAALHADRAAPRIPARIEIVADDGVDRVEVEFVARDVLQLIAGDPARRGYTFIHEVAGTFSARSEIDGESRPSAGLAIVELVD